jgi:hypothetical protein
MPRGAPEQLELELNRRKPCSSGKRAAASADAERLLELPDALLTRSHLRALGLERRAIDAVFRALPVVALPGYSRPLIRARDYVELVAANTYCGDRVRPIASVAGAARIG